MLLLVTYSNLNKEFIREEKSLLNNSESPINLLPLSIALRYGNSDLGGYEN